MTALPQGRGLAPAQLKTSATVHSSRFEAVRNDGEGRLVSRSQSRTRPSKIRHESSQADSTSQAATLSLIRRVLAPDNSQSTYSRHTPRPVEDLLPPLTTSNEIDTQLYAIIAIIMKDFVNVWYSKITPDHSFGEEVVQIMAHCSRALEERVRHLDMTEILLDELAALIEHHVKAYRYAKIQAEQYSYAEKLRGIYHGLNRHPALHPVPEASSTDMMEEQALNEMSYRQLMVQGTLAVLLPTDDIRNDPLRTMVSDILADLILGQVLAGKVCEPWFLHDLIIKSITVTKGNIASVSPSQDEEPRSKSRLEQFGLLSRKQGKHAAVGSSGRRKTITTLFWHVLQIVYTLALSVRFTFHGIDKAWNPSSRSSNVDTSEGSPISTKSSLNSHEPRHRARPVLSYQSFGMGGTLLQTQSRMPWFSSMLAFLQHFLLEGMGQIASLHSVFDRFLHESLTSILFPPTILPQILLSFRAAVFPHNSLGPPAPPPPSPEEQILLRRKAAESIVSLIPRVIAKTYFNTSDEDEIVEQVAVDILDCFSDAYLNKHLVYGVLELFLVRLMPELSEHSVSELLAERGVNYLDAMDDDIVTTNEKVPRP